MHCYRETEQIYLISFISELDASLSTDLTICILKCINFYATKQSDVIINAVMRKFKHNFFNEKKLFKGMYKDIHNFQLIDDI